jgi:hypothetical protein
VWQNIDVGRRRVFYLNIWLNDVCLYKLRWWEMHEWITMKMLKGVEKSVDWLVNEIRQTNS